MPTYFATGVTCKLAICEMKDGVSNVIDFQCREQHADAKRMNDALDKATPISEKLIKGEGENASVVQFLGLSRDMPMKMVVASSAPPRENEDVGVDKTKATDNDEDAANALLMLSSSSLGSPLTSLGATPTPTKLNFSTPLKPVKTPERSSGKIATPTTVVHSIEGRPQINGPQSLMLNITLTTASFMPVEAGGIRTKIYDNKDLKVEIVCIVTFDTKRKPC